MKIQTEVRHFFADAQLLSFVEQKILKLKFFFNHISEAYILLKMDNTRLQKERVVEIKIHIPNGFMLIRESCKTFEAALTKAIVALKLQLLRHKTENLKYCYIKKPEILRGCLF